VRRCESASGGLNGTLAPSHRVLWSNLNVTVRPLSRVSCRLGVGAAFAVVLAVAVAPGPSRAAAQPRGQSAAFPCDVQTTERIVAVGDIHGAYDKFVAILRAAGLIDARNRWTGKKAVLVQTGDILDRGPDSRKALDLLRKLEGDAQRAGGRVVSLLGNHELMRLVSDWRYVSQGETDAFKTADSADLRERAFTLFSTEAEKAAKAVGRPFDPAAYREQFMKEVPLGSLEMRFAFDAKGQYGAWVRQRATVARINGILFLHGGISDAVASLGCEGINAAVRKDLLSLPVPLEQVATLFAASETGPLWYRGLANEPEATLAPTLDSILERMRARAIVIGHTTVLPGRITPRLGGRVIEIDTGMVNGEFYPGGVPSALELLGDKLTAIYLDRREPLDVPAITTVPAAAGASR
jgi:Calcineurin-like phosphoesterase